MSWVTFLVILSTLYTYCATQITVSQSTSESVSLGETVTLPCTLSGYSFSIPAAWWIQVKEEKKPRLLLWYGSDSSKGQGPGVPDRFSGSKDLSKNVGYLTIKRVLLEDDADYYCAIWHSPSNSLHSGTLHWGSETRSTYDLVYRAGLT
ncbi:hypothetical protein XELAEV_18007641mg [Xenopus laevis]|uniref:Ig-like domain-containing protein n=1 Tax=Xenopus laevis TaxID=8355 RepID=A0A974E2A3_XENLA|nr:hypothetical protein XELAEV_18007641mg [Xenopus laevis]